MIDHIRRHAFYQEQNIDEPLGHCPLRRACEDRLDAQENAARCKATPLLWLERVGYWVAVSAILAAYVLK